MKTEPLDLADREGQMKTTRYALMAILVATGMAACSDSLTAPPRDVDAPVQTTLLKYGLTDSDGAARTVVALSFRNPLEKTVYFQRCRRIRMSVERLDGADWTLAYSQIYPDCQGPPVIVAPGEVVRDSLQIYAFPQGSNTSPQFQAGSAPPGHFRIRLHEGFFEYDSEAGQYTGPVEEGIFVSNVFVIR